MDLGQMRRPWQADTGRTGIAAGCTPFSGGRRPTPFLTTFDAPGGVQACTRRMRSDTPLQALTLLNDPAFVEIARGLAARILADLSPPASDRDRLDHAFRLCLGRRPLDGRAPDARGLPESRRIRHRAVSRGDGAAAEWVGIARILLNLDEFVTRE